MALDSGTRLGPYEILARIGAGGMGEVYRARDTRLDRMVAVKVLQAEATSSRALERFEREAKAIAAQNHPGICSIYDVGNSPVPYLVMELLDGVTLHQHLARGAMDVPALVDTGLALADALATAHGKGVIHRDLKPANIFLTPHGPKILDFGLARIHEAADPASDSFTAHPTLAAPSPLTDEGVAVGTVAYMSPEQVRGQVLDGRTDLFSLGLVLYEMATGRRAFGGTTGAETQAAILRDEPKAPRGLRPELPPRLEQAILTLLEKDRDVRTQTASGLRAELTRLKRELAASRASGSAVAAAASSDPTVRAPAAVSPAASPSPSDAQLIAGVIRKHRGLAAFTLATLLLLVLGAWLALKPGASRPESRAGAGLSIVDLTVEQLTTSGTAASPAISPDGKYVAYVEQGRAGDSLRVRQVATGSNIEIVAEEPGVRLAGLTVTPDGTFVSYVKRQPRRPDELWQVPFLGGAPRQLLVGVNSAVGYSPDGRQMAFVRDAGAGQSEVVIAAPDGSGARALAARRLPERFWALLTVVAGASFAPAWSPDGKTIVAIGAAGDQGELVFIEVQTGAARSVAWGSRMPATSVVWLDEGRLLMSALELASQPLNLWLVAYPRGEFRRLTNDLSHQIGVSLTADGRELVTMRGEAWVSIWTSDAAGTRWTETIPRTPTNGSIGLGVRWLGDDLVFPSTASGTWQLERWRASTRTREMVGRAGGLPQVTPDGSTLVYYDYDAFRMWKLAANGPSKMVVEGGRLEDRLTPDGRHLAAVDSPAGGPATVRLRPIDAKGDARVVTSERVRTGGRVLVSPDGQRILFPSFDDQGAPVVAVCDLPTCASRRTLPPIATQWTPDSQGVAYVDPQMPWDLWAQPLAGGPPRKLTHFTDDGTRIFDYAWTSDGRRLAVARYSQANNIVLLRGLKP